jgi:peptide-methionine (S)-S-oxide reductase
MTEKATFAAGCFWGVEADFRKLDGVVATRVGYTGGVKDEPTYKEVCSGMTGHAEAVEVEFDPAQVSYDELLEVFWSIHDPTTPNRQGWDVGTQYRSAIFVHDEAQQAAAEASRERAQERVRRPIVTEITPASTFWIAEDYHQRYLEKQGRASCTPTLRESLPEDERDAAPGSVLARLLGR